MKVEVRFVGVTPNKPLERYIRWKLESELEPQEQDVRAIAVRLARVAGLGMVCRISARIHRNQRLVTDHSARHPLEAIDGAVQKLADAAEHMADDAAFAAEARGLRDRRMRRRSLRHMAFAR